MKKLLSLLMMLFTTSILAQQPAPPRLIVRADDMGYSHAGNEAILKSYKEGIATSVEIIVPSPWFPEAVKLLTENPNVDVGIHLALTAEWDNVKWRPLTDCPSLRDPDGYFFPMVYPNKNYPGRSIAENAWKLEDIEQEVRAQIKMAKKKIPRISHVSAHMGFTSLDPKVRALVERLSKEYGLMFDTAGADVKRATYLGPKKTSAEKITSFIKMIESLEPGKTYLFVDHPGLAPPKSAPSIT
ncbi:MAG TPA: polysaccharide deacetylase family protein [Verrucomicrobiae bacterium]